MHSSWYWRKRIPEGRFITGSRTSAGDDAAVARHRVRNESLCWVFENATVNSPLEAGGIVFGGGIADLYKMREAL